MKCKTDEKTFELEFQGTAAELLKKLNIRRETVIVKANGRIVPENEMLGPDDTVEIMRVIFGG